MYNFHTFQVFKLGKMKMCEVKKCCCCVDLRTGAIVMAILEIIGGFGLIGKSTEWPDILNVVVAIGAGVCLLFGAIKYHQLATLVYLVLQMIAIVLIVVAIIVAIVAFAALSGAAVTLIVIPLIIYGIFVSVHIYFWVCVFSFYKGLKTGTIKSPA